MYERKMMGMGIVAMVLLFVAIGSYAVLTSVVALVDPRFLQLILVGILGAVLGVALYSIGVIVFEKEEVST